MKPIKNNTTLNYILFSMSTIAIYVNIFGKWMHHNLPEPKKYGINYNERVKRINKKIIWYFSVCNFLFRFSFVLRRKKGS